MTATNSFEGNITPLFGQRETGRFVFDPSEELAERLWGLARPSYQKEMGRRGLFLYSNTSVDVTRRTDGSLEPADALMESEIRKVLGQKPNETQRRLARYVTGGMVRNRMTNEPLGVKVNVRVLLDIATINKIKTNRHIPTSLLSHNAVEAGLMIPIQYAMPGPQLRHRYEDLERFLHGPDWHPSMREEGRHSPSQSLGAYVTNMRMTFRPAQGHK